MITKDNFKDVLEKLGFTESKNIYAKPFKEFDCELKVDFNNETLIFPKDKGMVVNNKTTSNFSSAENFVVFECIDKLLTQGYHPKHIEIEKEYQLGHTGKSGRADIVITDNDHNSLLIIECKTAGTEYTKAIKILESDARNQLFSYLQQATSTKFLALYASDFADEKIIGDYYLINVSDNKDLLLNNPTLKSYKETSIYEEKYQVWCETYDKEYATIGIFEDNKPYEIGKTKFNINDLQPVSSKDIQEKYNKFATILRKYNVSGRENAFDKLVNLFLCKVVDEKQNSNNLNFYYKGKAYDNPFDFQDRLQQLYKDGMKEFLGEDITYIDNNQIDDIFKLYDLETIKIDIKQVLKEQKFFTNNDFAFIDVHNEKLFYQNFQVLLEIAKLIQDINLTSSDENQFLGDMFEGFLDQGVKQSEGQFFTPMPIVKFIINSLPPKDTPKVIDYACGSGHFLNEYFTQNRKSKIIGCEKEYRLSKVAKVSSFMYGSNMDIIYSDALKKNKKMKDNSFDVLIANPPYSVKGFIDTLSQEEKDNFELLKTIDEKSYTTNNAIECFFIERSKQLLKKDAVAGIVVPSSILNKGDGVNTYAVTREIILKYFDIVAISEFGSGTFGKTATNTVTLFLKRRCDVVNIAKTFEELSEQLFDCKIDFDKVLKDKDMLEKYCFHIDIEFDIYKTILCDSLEDEIFKYDIFKEYKNEFEKLTTTKNRKKKAYYKNLSDEEKEKLEDKELLKYIKIKEKDKFYYFCLAYKNSSDVVIVKAPTSNSENKKFLGYEWSGRKGNEGIQYNGDSLDNINTMLYNPKIKDDDKKINKIISDNFKGIKTTIADELESYVSRAKLIDMLDFSRVDFNKAISLSPSRSIEIESRYPLKRIESILVKIKGNTTKISKDEILDNGKYPVITQEADELISGYTNQFKAINDLPLVVFGDHNCSFKYIDFEFIRGADGTQLLKPNNKFNIQYFYYILQLVNIPNKEKYERHTKYLNSLKIPLPPLDIQKQIVKECKDIDDEVLMENNIIEQTKTMVENEINSISDDTPKIALAKISKSISSGLTPLRSNSEFWKDATIPWLKTEQLGTKYIYDTNEKISKIALENTSIKINKKDTLSIAMYGEGKTRGSLSILKSEMATNQACCNVYLDEKKAYYEYVYQYLKTQYHNLRSLSSGVRKNLNTSDIKNYPVPLPDLKTQKEIVIKIQKLEDKITKAQIVVDGAKLNKEEILRKYL